MRIELLSTSEDHTEAIGAALGQALRPGDVAALHGDLGAGKTRLVRGIAQGMGLDPALVSSPTFVIVNEYQTGDILLVHLDAYRLHGPDDLDSLGWDRLLDGRSVIAIEWADRIDRAGDGGSAPSSTALPGGGLTQDSGQRPRATGGASGGHVRAGALPGPDRRLDIYLAAANDPAHRHIVIEAADAWAPRLGAAGALPGASPVPAPHPTGDEPLPLGWARCPVSGRPVPPDSPTFPFFDARCRMADLGRWLSGAYAVSRDLTEEEIAEPDGLNDRRPG